MIDHAGSSEQGPVRTNNEDFIAHHSPVEDEVRSAKGHLFVVADGVGGSAAGEVASREAAQSLVSGYYGNNGKRPGRALQDAFRQCNLHVYDLAHSNPEYRRMETTLSALVVIGNQAYIGHVGDTRVYLIRGPEIRQLTKDHSEVGELVRMQLLTRDEARHHPRRNVITRSVGSELLLQAEFRTETVELGDTFVLCTDGLWEPVEENEIAEAVRNHSAADACRLLLDLAIERGTSDNLSIQVIKVLEWGEQTTPAAAREEGLFRRVLGWFGKESKGS